MCKGRVVKALRQDTERGLTCSDASRRSLPPPLFRKPLVLFSIYNCSCQDLHYVTNKLPTSVIALFCQRLGIRIEGRMGLYRNERVWPLDMTLMHRAHVKQPLSSLYLYYLHLPSSFYLHLVPKWRLLPSGGYCNYACMPSRVTRHTPAELC